MLYDLYLNAMRLFKPIVPTVLMRRLGAASYSFLVVPLTTWHWLPCRVSLRARSVFLHLAPPARLPPRIGGGMTVAPNRQYQWKNGAAAVFEKCGSPVAGALCTAPKYGRYAPHYQSLCCDALILCPWGVKLTRLDTPYKFSFLCKK